MKYFEQIFRTLPVPCVVLQPRGSCFVIYDANKSYVEVTGISEENLIGFLADEVLPKNSNQKDGGPELLLQSLQKVRSSGKEDKIPVLRYDIPDRATGEFLKKFWSIENYPLFGVNGEVEFVLHMVQDITTQVLINEDQKKIKEELAEYKEQYQHYVEGNPDAIYTLDLEGNFLDGNEGLAQIIEMPLKELLRADFWPFCTSHHKEKISYHFQKGTRGEITCFEADFISARGRVMTLVIWLRPMKLDGEVRGVYGLAKDITNQRQAEKFMVEKKKFLTVNAAFISSLMDNELEKEVLEDAFGMIGDTVQVDRMYYFGASRIKQTHEFLISQKIEWTSHKASSTINNPEMQNLPGSQVEQIMGPLIRNRPFKGKLSELPEGLLKDIFLDQDIKSMLLLPIFFKDQLYGFVGFDDCEKERNWSDDEVSFLRTLTQSFGVVLEKKAAEEALMEREEQIKRSERKFKALVQEGSDLMGIMDMEGNYKFVSETTTAILGLRPEDFIGNNAFDFIHPEDKDRVQEEYSRLERVKQVKITSFRFVDKEGNWRWLETTLTNLMDDPAVEGIVHNTRDITAFRAQALEIATKNEALEIANKRFKRAMKATNEMIWDWDVPQNIIIRSKGFNSIFEYCSKESSSTVESWMEKIIPEDRKRIEASLMRALEDVRRRMWKEEYRLEKGNGEMAYVTDRGYIIRDNAGQAKRMVGAVLDVTESRRQIKKIKKQNKILRSIAWEQAHVVRAPLARLQGLLALLEEDDTEEWSREEILNHINSSADELDEIVKGIIKKTEIFATNGNS